MFDNILEMMELRKEVSINRDIIIALLDFLGHPEQPKAPGEFSKLCDKVEKATGKKMPDWFKEHKEQGRGQNGRQS